jgi:hypothetical protein
MHRFAIAALALFLPAAAFAQDPAPAQPKTIAQATEGQEKLEGFFHLHWEASSGKLRLEIDKWDEEFLYINSLPAGVGSNDIGLDRGQLGSTRIVKFERVGPKVMLVQPNYDYRAITNDPAERKAVEDAFARSILWGFKVEAEEAGRVLVDATDFFVRDVHGVVQSLRGQGSYSLDASRSAVFMPRTKAFPRNTEVEVTLTFTGNATGAWIRSVAPDPSAVTVRQHHSFVALPEPGFKMRPYDPRSGVFGMSYMDYATPIAEPIVKRFARRHRLAKVDPTAPESDAVEPIVYYLDTGAPEPIRSALLEGARWWAQAFEVLGYRNAFRVEMLPEDADPMDVRYNVINWVHRSTRGWSYGSSVSDPRTGEIIKGQVTLGSLRVRQDFLIAEGLLAPYEEGRPADPRMEAMALARLRQLSAHEVGHTLGFAHNFAASVPGRASVMDYPHPFVRLSESGQIDLSDAYAVGIGEWDKVATAYAYQDFPPGVNEAEALRRILDDAAAGGLVFITDADARAPGGAHPRAHLWDNGIDAAIELTRVMAVRRVALDRFGEKNIRPGAPMTTLEEVLAPIYLFHRYQVDAASKSIGGLDYTYALRGDGRTVTAMIPPADQRRAMAALLATLDARELAIPERILKSIPPRAAGYGRTRETFNIRTSPAFDPLAAAETAADMTVSFLLRPERAARMIEHHARDKKQPSFDELLDRLVGATWKKKESNDYHAEIGRVVDGVVLNRLMQLAADQSARVQARALVQEELIELKHWANRSARWSFNDDRRAHLRFAADRIALFLEDPGRIDLSPPPAPPDGPPIGMAHWASEDVYCAWRE